MLRLPFYLLRYALFIVRTILFRLYLLLIFFSKQAAPALVVLLTIAGFWLTWPVSGAPFREFGDALFAGMLEDALRMPLDDGERLLKELMYAGAPFVMVAAGLFALWWVLGWLRWILLFLLPAFPYPQRPVPPLWPLRAKKHVIERVDCRIAVKAPHFRYWDGDLKPLIARLAPPLLAIIANGTQNASQRPVFAAVRVASPVSACSPAKSAPKPTQGNSGVTVATPAVVKASQKRPAGPKLPPKAALPAK